jgi:hypothetical protein
MVDTFECVSRLDQDLQYADQPVIQNEAQSEVAKGTRAGTMNE